MRGRVPEGGRSKGSVSSGLLLSSDWVGTGNWQWRREGCERECGSGACCEVAVDMAVKGFVREEEHFGRGASVATGELG